MASAGTLEIDLIANIARLTDDMNKAVGTVGSSMKSIERSIESAKGVLASFGFGLSALGIARLAQEGLEWADSMGKLAQKTGVSVESLSQMTVAAKLANVDMEVLAKGMEHISQAAALAASGSSTQAKAFDALGIHTRTAAGDMKNADQLMREVADRFAAVNDGAGKTAAAMAIFGKSGADLIPVLNKGSAELDQMAKLSDQLGLTLNNQTTEAATKINDDFTKMGLAAKGAGMELLEQMLPTLDHLSQGMLDAATQGGTLKGVIEELAVGARVMVGGFQTIGFVLQEDGKLLGAIAASVNAVIHRDFASVSIIMKQTLADAKSDFDAYSTSITKLWEESTKAQEKAQQHKKTLNLDLGPGSAGSDMATHNLNARIIAEMEKQQQEIDAATYRHDVEVENRKIQLQKDTYLQLYQLAQAGELSLTDLHSLSAQQRLGTAITGFSQLIGAAGQHSIAMFNIAKTLALAQAAIDLPKTVMAAYRVGTEFGGPILGTVYAAIAATAQLINMAAIKSASFGGGGGSAASAGGTSGIPGQVANQNVIGPAPVAQAAAPPRTVNIHLSGTDIYSAENVRDQLIPALRDAIGDGVVLNVTSQ